MNYWHTTDTHLGHNKMKLSGYRPDDFEEKLLRNLRNAVSPGDILIHHGDIAFDKDEYWHAQLMEATKVCMSRWLLLGNHDKKSMGWYLTHGWSCVTMSMTLDVYGKRIALSHMPMDIPHYIDINIHGHVHDKPIPPASPRHKLLVMEHTYMPVTLRSICDGFKPENL